MEIEVSNYCDMVAVEHGHLAAEQVRRARVRAVVQPQAVHLALPEKMVRELGVPKKRRTRIRYRNGRTAIRDMVEAVYLEIFGRGGTFTAIVEPIRKDAVIGMVVLGSLDLLPDPGGKKVVPRDPKGMTAEL